MKKVISMVVCATVVLLAAGVVMAGEGKGKAGCKKGDFFAKADADKDGKISLAEFKAVCTKPDADAKFTAMDADKDGFVTKEEMKAAHPAKHGKKGEKGVNCTAPVDPAPVAPAAPVAQ